MKILIIDDHEMFRVGLQALLAAKGGFEVVGHTHDRRRVGRLVDESRPDVVLTDCRIHDADGLQHVKRIRADGNGPKVICLSSVHDPWFIRSLLKAGANGCVSKADPFDELVRALNAVAADEVFLSRAIANLANEIDAKPAEPDIAAIHALTTREREMIQQIADGRTTKQIARALRISVKTVETQRRKLMRKLNLHGIAGLTRFAIRHGITSIDPS